MMCVNGKTRPHPARCATFSPRAKATIGFSPRRSCHEVTDEVKAHGLMLPAAVCGTPPCKVKTYVSMLFSARIFIISKENAPFLNGASVCKIK